MTTGEIADAYIALRTDHDVGDAANMIMARHSISSQDLVDALGAEILNMNRPEYERMREYRNEVLSHFTATNRTSQTG